MSKLDEENIIELEELDTPEETAENKKDNDVRSESAKKIVFSTCLILSDFVLLPLIMAYIAWVLAFGVIAVSNGFMGVVMIMSLDGFILGSGYIAIPEMPSSSSFFIGMALLALGTLSGIWTEISRMYLFQAIRKSIRFHRNILGKKSNAAPPLPLHPWITPGKRNIMRIIAKVSVAVLITGIVLAFVTMIISARSLEPWHVWEWFGGTPHS